MRHNINWRNKHERRALKQKGPTARKMSLKKHFSTFTYLRLVK